MQICVIGTGYVGLVAGACLAEAGHVVTCLDKNALKIAQLACGAIGIHEPGLPELVSRNLARGRIAFASDLSRHGGAQLYFITVGTPSNADTVMAFPRFWRWKEMANRCASSRIRCSR